MPTGQPSRHSRGVGRGSGCTPRRSLASSKRRRCRVVWRAGGADRVGAAEPAQPSGLLFLDALTEPQLNAYFERVAMLPFTCRTDTLVSQVRASVQRVRAQGHAVCDRTLTNDLRSIAVPVRDARGELVAAMVCVVEAGRFGEADLHATLLPALTAAAREAGHRWR